MTGTVVPETSPLIAFTENAFAQFFQNVVRTEITGFDFRAKREAASLRYKKKGELGKPVIALISLFEQFCDTHDDVIGAGYGGQTSVLEDFHRKLVVRLLKRLSALAAAVGDPDLAARAKAALKGFQDAVEHYDWSGV